MGLSAFLGLNFVPAVFIDGFKQFLSLNGKTLTQANSLRQQAKSLFARAFAPAQGSFAAVA